MTDAANPLAAKPFRLALRFRRTTFTWLAKGGETTPRPSRPEWGGRYVQLGRPDKARPIIDDYLDTHPNDEGGSLTGVRALLLAKAGQTVDARGAIARAIELGTGFGHFHHTAYNIAATYAALDERDEAVTWVEAATDDGFPCYPFFARDPNLDSLREVPRFVELMSQLHKRWRNLKRVSEA